MKLWIRTPFAFAALAAAVSFSACSDDDDPTGPQDEVTVEMDDNFFSPEEVHLNVGGTVTWVNVGDRDHTTTSGTWDSGGMETDQEYARTFTTAGTFEYECTFHEGMVGEVIVD